MILIDISQPTFQGFSGRLIIQLRMAMDVVVVMHSYINNLCQHLNRWRIQ